MWYVLGERARGSGGGTLTSYSALNGFLRAMLNGANDSKMSENEELLWRELAKRFHCGKAYVRLNGERLIGAMW